MSVKPLGERVLLEVPEVKEEKTSSGLFVPDTAKEKPLEAIVVAVGSKVEDVKAGDRVIYAKFAGNEVKVDDKAYLLMEINDVLAVIE
ncbi:MAG: co-chaperone GroES [Bacillota bacterium]|jgi:chaperonin GroES